MQRFNVCLPLCSIRGLLGAVAFLFGASNVVSRSKPSKDSPGLSLGNLTMNVPVDKLYTHCKDNFQNVQ